jgi:hypothetical protein
MRGLVNRTSLFRPDAEPLSQKELAESVSSLAVACGQ